MKTMLMQNFGGQVRCIWEDVQVAYKSLLNKERIGHWRHLHPYSLFLVPAEETICDFQKPSLSKAG